SPQNAITIVIKSTRSSSFELHLVLTFFEVYRDRLVKLWFKSQLLPLRERGKMLLLYSQKSEVANLTKIF
ncbi:MAG: hypothetical protein KME64_01410, partial [Scytonematopsis contorta HA4267-MV1]|nr:hypothetical protein [Scytonematopsis contorta HA4267-MV1]